MKRLILTVDCPERIGIVHRVTGFLVQHHFSVVEAAEYADLENQRFFARWEFAATSNTDESVDVAELKNRFREIAVEFGMTWELHDASVKTRMLIAVSKFGHCLHDLLYRWKHEEFPADVVGVVSNHEDFREDVQWLGLPYYYLPVSPETKPQQERKILEIMRKENVDLLVLARYMQILSDDMCREIDGKAINIHHSFLPSFKGARPYHQAHERGVKIAGATAHYVTSDLDEGPIIEQDVHRIEHNHDAARMARLGKNIEKIVLARAVYLHCQHRIFLNGGRTVIFR